LLLNEGLLLLFRYDSVRKLLDTHTKHIGQWTMPIMIL